MGPESCKMKAVMWMDGGDGCATARMCFMPLSCALRVVKMVSFMLCVFYHIKGNKKCELSKECPRHTSVSPWPGVNS